MDNIEYLENEFIKDITETGRFILSIGIKGGGKTYKMLQFVKYALYNNIYERYHLILPMYEAEQNDSYGFLRNQQHCYIYNGYSEKVSKLVEKDRLKYKTLFIIDDASAELVKNMDNTFMKIITTTRHGQGCTLWACVHSAKRILAPVVRQNIDWLFVYKIANRKLLIDIYEEYASMTFDTLNEFMQLYKSAMDEKYNAVLFTIQSSNIDPMTNEWETLKSYQDITLKPHAPIKKPVEKKEPNDKKLKINNLNTMLSHMFKKKRF